jgi:hypothetical protein
MFSKSLIEKEKPDVARRFPPDMRRAQESNTFIGLPGVWG